MEFDEGVEEYNVWLQDGDGIFHLVHDGGVDEECSVALHGEEGADASGADDLKAAAWIVGSCVELAECCRKSAFLLILVVFHVVDHGA